MLERRERGELGGAANGAGTVRIEAISEVVRTRALLPPGGGPQPDYLNAVAVIRTGLEPLELLGLCRRIESACGRTRGERWGARTLDLDLLFFEGRASDTVELRLPHPDWAGRKFVLGPLLDRRLETPMALAGFGTRFVPPDRKRLLELLERA